MGQNNYIIRKAVRSDLDEIKTLADAHKRELGFTLRPTLAESIARGEVFVAADDADLIGFVDYRHRKDEQTTLYHLVVSPEWRQRGVGRGLIEALQTEATERGKDYILLKCPEDLPANAFYQKLGFELTTSENGRSRKLNVWRLTLSVGVRSEIL
jgi:ribosomal protein S18 acetylase RimI-like enzyme